jgi:hypothetical protein
VAKCVPLNSPYSPPLYLGYDSPLKSWSFKPSVQDKFQFSTVPKATNPAPKQPQLGEKLSCPGRDFCCLKGIIFKILDFSGFELHFNTKQRYGRPAGT